MRFHLPFVVRLRAALKHRDWFGVAIEMLAVVLSVILGLEASQWSARRAEAEYRRQMIAAIDQSLADFEVGGRVAHSRAATALAAFRMESREGRRPAPPILHYRNLDRPPTRAWDAIVTTGVARDLDPEIFFRLARLYSSADSWSEQYQRYNRFSEEQILPYTSETDRFYRNGKLAPIFAAHVERMRELIEHGDQMTSQAHDLRRDLRKAR